ncbi:MAG: YdcF family protein [Labilithrix sp.]|nr:YdcF family protein [Labilithrix sp.]
MSRAMGVCVLGCRAGSAALARRAHAASAAFVARGASLAVACGGRAWGGCVEADEIARMMRDDGVPASAIVRERCSLDTRDNARFAAALLARRGVSRVLVVTCTWHLPRAVRLFRATGLEVEGCAVDPPSPTPLQKAYWRGREWISSMNEARKPVRIL